jgi:hypothetical protein
MDKSSLVVTPGPTAFYGGNAYTTSGNNRDRS